MQDSGFIALPTSLSAASLDDSALHLVRRRQASAGRPLVSGILGTLGFFYPYEHTVEDRAMHLHSPVRVVGFLNRDGYIEAPRSAWCSCLPHLLRLSSPSRLSSFFLLVSPRLASPDTLRGGVCIPIRRRLS